MCVDAGRPIALSSDAHVPEHARLRATSGRVELLASVGVDASSRSSRGASGAWSRSDERRRGPGSATTRTGSPRGRRLILGGVEVAGAERGLDGHSDADVLTHAVIDALLGAAGLGDIGEHFPDTDERWRDADSIELLREVVRDAAATAGWAVGNVDATVICERAEARRRTASAMRDDARRRARDRAAAR